MAIVYDPNDKKNKAVQPGQAPAQPGQLTSGQSSVITGQNPGAPSQQKAGSSGRFTNVQQYFRANNPQQLTQRVSGDISEVKQKAAEQLGKATQQVESQAQQIGNIVNASREQQQALASNLRQGLQQDVAVQDFDPGYEALKSGIGMQYQGVDELQNQIALRGRAQDLEALSGATQNAKGRAALLQRFYGNPNYKSGARNLDTALLGAGAKDLRKLASTGLAFRQDLNQGVQQAQKSIGAQREGISKFRDESKALAGTLAGESEADVREQFAQFKAREEAARQAALDPNRIWEQGKGIDIGEGATLNLDAKELQDLGIAQFKSGLENINEQNLADIARVNVGQASQLSKLRGLIGADQFIVGDQLKQGEGKFNQEEFDRIMKNVDLDYRTGGKDKYLGNIAREYAGDIGVDWSGTKGSAGGYSWDYDQSNQLRQLLNLYGRRLPQIDEQVRSMGGYEALTRKAQELEAKAAENKSRAWEAVQSNMAGVMTPGHSAYSDAKTRIFKTLLNSFKNRG